SRCDRVLCVAPDRQSRAREKTMFDKLVVSTAQSRRGRTAKFFLSTVVIYLSTVAIAFALSIFLATPKLADTRSTIVLGTLAPPAPRTPRVVDHRTTVGVPRQ